MISLAQSPRRAAIYVRVSTAGQEEDGTSLETQEAACRRYAAEHGYIVDEAHVYREVHTGTELWERRVLQRAREAVRAREVAAVIAYAIDRLARDPVHLGVLVSEAEHAGTDVLFVTEPLDNSPEGQLIRFVRGYAAKVEHEKIRERAIRGRRARVEGGKLLSSGRPRFGYRWRDETKAALDVDDVKGPIVQRIFSLAASGVSLRGIVTRLNDDGVPTATGRSRWQLSTVRTVLLDPRYTGRAAGLRYRMVKVKSPRTGKVYRQSVSRPESEQISLPSGIIPPLVDPETFANVQDRLRLNKERAARNNQDPESALLRAGFARCGYCGSVLVHLRGRIYRCPANSAAPGTCDGRPSITAQALDGAVWGRVSDILTRPELVATELERLKESDPTVDDLAAVDKELTDVGRRQRNLVDQLTNVSGAVADLVTEKLSTLEAHRRELASEREGILARRQSWQAAQDRINELETWCRSVAANLGMLTYQEKRMALDALNVQVRVWKADHTPRYEITASIPLNQTIVNTASGR